MGALMQANKDAKRYYQHMFDDPPKGATALLW